MRVRPGTMAITMAGAGARFAAAGYAAPKYRIAALGRPLFDWAMLSLAAFRETGWEFSFAARAEDGAEDFIRARCAALNIRVIEFLELDRVTDGQATTAQFLARKAVAEAPFAVFNIDTYVRPGAMDPAHIPEGCDGWIPCFPGPGEGWSFVRVAEGSDKAVELREKQRISAHATLGLYWFASAKSYLGLYDAFFATGGQEKGEKYIAPMYNRLIADGRDVRIARLALEDVGMLGTPEQVEAFIAAPPPSAEDIRRMTLPE